MPRYDARQAACQIYAFKAGALSGFGHDLQLRVERFEIAIDEQSHAIQAWFDPASVRVVCAMKDGSEAPGALSESDRAEIQRNLARSVLDPGGEIQFSSTAVWREGSAFRVRGQLTLNGHTRPLSFEASESGGRWTAEIPLQQPEFGIKPFSAMLGALKIRPEVRVRISLPA